MRASAYEDYECLDFDLACMAWWDQFDALREEKKRAHKSAVPQLGANQIWIPAYPNDAAILEHLQGIGVDVLDPVLEGVTGEDLLDLLGDWEDMDA